MAVVFGSTSVSESPLRDVSPLSPYSLTGLLHSRYGAIARLGGWSLLLALCTAAYGALAGPALRAVFGGDDLVWPVWIAGYLPAPPTISELRTALPVVIVMVAVAKGLSFHRHTVGMVRLAEGVNVDLRAQLHRMLLAARSDGVYALGGGELISRFMDDVEAVGRLAADGVCGALRDGVQVVALLCLCLLLDWRLAVVSFVIYPVAFWPIARLGRRLRRSHLRPGARAVRAAEAACSRGRGGGMWERGAGPAAR